MLTFSPFNITFLISPSQSNFILAFSPLTLRILSVLNNGIFHPYFQPLNKFLIRQDPCRGISFSLSAPHHYISYQSLAPEYFTLTFSPSRLRFLSVPHKRISYSLLANLTSHFLSVPHKGISFLLSSPPSKTSTQTCMSQHSHTLFPSSPLLKKTPPLKLVGGVRVSGCSHACCCVLVLVHISLRPLGFCICIF